MRLKALAVAAAVVLPATGALVPVGAGAAEHAGSYIVLLRDGASGSAAAERHGAAPTHVYRSALDGYAAVLGEQARSRAARDPQVVALVPDRPVRATAQDVPTGVRRINSRPSRYDGVNDAVSVDVAVIDSGIAAHTDLQVAGGVNCSSGKSYSDGNGHGTHVAGTIAARDNAVGVSGVAPGARLWAVRVLNNAGSGTTSSVVCGVDWVTRNARTIEVANMSLGGPGTDTGNCGPSSTDPMHRAICASVAAGVTYVVAAGNEGVDAAGSTPAAYDQVITVSALADYDGLAGGLAPATCRVDDDDTFAAFSNFGADVDIAAPGVCITSTWKGGGYNTISGTSMASPHVAGAAALYKAGNPAATPDEVRAALLQHRDTLATPVVDDPDGSWEGLLDLTGWL